LLLGVPVRDLTGGFKCFRREVLESFDLDDVQSNGYCFQIEMTYRAIQQRFKDGERRLMPEEVLPDPNHVREITNNGNPTLHRSREVDYVPGSGQQGVDTDSYVKH
jgi:hypothetical protein